MTGADDAGGGVNGREHARGICATGPYDVECGAMSHTRSDEGEAERDVDRLVHADEFHRNMTLIVVERHNAIPRSAKCTLKKCVGGQGAGGVDPQRHKPRHGGRDKLLLLVSKKASFSAVRVECCHGDARWASEKSREPSMKSLSGSRDEIDGEPLYRRSQGLVERSVDYAQGGAIARGWEPEHHRRGAVVEAACPGQEFGVSGYVVASGVERLLMKWTGDDRCRESVQNGGGCTLNGCGSGAAPGRCDHAIGYRCRIDWAALRLHDKDLAGSGWARVHDRDRHDRCPRETGSPREDLVEHGTVGDNPQPCARVGSLAVPRERHDLRTDPGRITTGQENERSLADGCCGWHSA